MVYTRKVKFGTLPNFSFSELKKSRLDYKLYLPSVDLDSKFTGVMESAKIAESDALVWPTESLWQADDRRSVILTTILDALMFVLHQEVEVPGFIPESGCTSIFFSTHSTFEESVWIFLTRGLDLSSIGSDDRTPWD
jgi:hypothetical protein